MYTARVKSAPLIHSGDKGMNNYGHFDITEEELLYYFPVNRNPNYFCSQPPVFCLNESKILHNFLKFVSEECIVGKLQFMRNEASLYIFILFI